MGNTTDEIVFYTHPQSRGRIVRWMLEEVGQPYRTEVLEYGGGMKSADYLAINPMGKVPAIVHRGVVVTETAAVCAYLADAFPQAGLAPDVASPARAPYYRWLFFAAGPLEAAVSDKALGVEVPADKEAMVGYGKITDVLDTLEEPPFLLSSTASRTRTTLAPACASPTRPARTRWWRRRTARSA